MTIDRASEAVESDRGSQIVIQLLTCWASNSSFDYTVGHKFWVSAEKFPAQTAEGMRSEI